MVTRLCGVVTARWIHPGPSYADPRRFCTLQKQRRLTLENGLGGLVLSAALQRLFRGVNSSGKGMDGLFARRQLPQLLCRPRTCCVLKEASIHLP